jgi:hypothetical protein
LAEELNMNKDNNNYLDTKNKENSSNKKNKDRKSKNEIKKKNNPKSLNNEFNIVHKKNKTYNESFIGNSYISIQNILGKNKDRKKSSFIHPNLKKKIDKLKEINSPKKFESKSDKKGKSIKKDIKTYYLRKNSIPVELPNSIARTARKQGKHPDRLEETKEP